MDFIFSRIEKYYPYNLLLLADETVVAINKYLPYSDVYIAKQQGKIVGVISLLPVDKQTIEIKNIAISPAYQGKGLGSWILKKAEEIATYDGIAPQWFQEGIEFLLYAPTAYNKQDFVVKGNDNKVRLYSESGSFGEIETGIGKYHFEVGAGKENFEWIE